MSYDAKREAQKLADEQKKDFGLTGLQARVESSLTAAFNAGLEEAAQQAENVNNWEYGSAQSTAGYIAHSIRRLKKPEPGVRS
jgi:hypothetical protein